MPYNGTMAISETARDAAILAVEMGISSATAARWLRGERVAPGTAYGLRLAAERMGIDPPDDEPETEET
jgi:transcriptional regulator with XRE-family HTH domain